MTEDEARVIASDIVEHLLEVDILKTPDHNDMWAWDIITERLLINMNEHD